MRSPEVLEPASSALAGSTPAPGAPAVIAAVDLRIERERHADELVVALCESVTRAGGSSVLGATHWAEGEGRRHVAITIEAGGLHEARMQEAIERAVAAEGDALGSAAIRIGSRTTGPEALQSGLIVALDSHARRTSGRVVVFPDSGAVAQELSVGALLQTTAIDRVVQLAAGDAEPATILRTRGHLRPRWEFGSLVLHVQEARGGALVPFEVPDPTPCCAVHA